MCIGILIVCSFQVLTNNTSRILKHNDINFFNKIINNFINKNIFKIHYNTEHYEHFVPMRLVRGLVSF